MSVSGVAPLLVKASAGTGKTFQLSNRLLALLAAGERPEKILATTFTRKAAGEIYNRVVLRLAAASESLDEARKLGDFIENPSLSPEAVRSLLQDLLRDQHRISICTLDSFCIQIALCFAVELGLDPNWTILDAASVEDTAEEALAALFEDLSNAELVELTRGLAKGQSYRSTFERLKREVMQLYGAYRHAPDEAWDSVVPPSGLSPEKLAEALKLLEHQEVPKTKAGKPNSKWQSSLHTAVENARNGNWESFIEKGIASKIIAGETFLKIEVPPPLLDSFTPLIQHAKSVLLGELRRRNLAAFSLLARYHQIFSELKARQNAIEFSDVKELLARASVMGDLEQVYFRIDSKISHLLLDEFQDTSLLEWKVIVPIVEEILSHADGEHSFFCVGDVKQAIYGWRGGVVEIFSDIEQNWPHVETMCLDKSYRSSPEIVKFVNAVFKDPVSNQALSNFKQSAAEWAKDFRAHETAMKFSGYVEVRESEKLSEETSTLESNIEYIVGKLQEILQKPGEISVGILVRRNDDIPPIISSLRAHGFHASGEGGSLLEESSLVRLVFSLLTLIDHPTDTISRYHVAQSSFAGMLGLDSFDAQIDDFLKRERARASMFGIGEVMSSWVASLRIGADEFDLVRLEKLLDLAYAQESQIGSRMDRLITLASRTRVEDRTMSDIKVMTIHQSKGLEFDAVFLPTLDAPFISNVRSPYVSWSPTALDSPSMISVYPSTLLRSLDGKLSEMYTQCEQNALKEGLCVFYVALTRAKRALYAPLCAPVSRKSFSCSPASYLRSLFLGAPQGEEGQVLHESGNEKWFVELSSKEQIPIVRQPLPAKAKRDLPVQPTLQKITPSKKDERGGASTILPNYRTDEVYARLRGIYFHSVLEGVEWLDPTENLVEQLQRVRIRERGRIPLRNEELNALYDELVASLGSEEVFKLFDRSVFESSEISRIEVFCEFPYSYHQEGKVFRGVIDRLVVRYDHNGVEVDAEVIDFKSDRVSLESEDLDRYVQMYERQLLFYRSAVSECFSLDPSVVGIKLAFLSIGKVVSL